jgi:esterase
MNTLPHQRVGSESAPRTALVLHGILGSKTNWRTVARTLSEALPDWAFVLPDLRNHGDAQEFAGPHTLDAVCNDLEALRDEIHRPFDAVIGHSYGGKCALSWVERVHGDLSLLVTIDSNPGARTDRRGAETTTRAVEALGEMESVFASRELFVTALTQRGFSRDLAAWMAMNLVSHETGYRLRTNVAAIREMLDDYFVRDLWHVVETPPGRVRVNMLLGGRSTSLDAADRARVERVVETHPSRVACEVVEHAGHWVHVDAPNETRLFLLKALSRL